MSFDPYGGLNVHELIDPEEERTLNRITQSAPIDFEQMRRSTSVASRLANSMSATASMMPQLVAEAVNTPGASLTSLSDQFAPVEQALGLEQWRTLVDTYRDGMDEAQQWELWQRLPLSVTRSLVADGYPAPTEPQKGGIDIPFTSIVRRAINAVPGVDIGGNGNFEIAGGSDNAFTRAANRAGQVVEAPVEYGIKPLVSGVIEGMDYLENTLVSRPLTVGNLRADELGMNSASGTSGRVLDSAGRVPGMSSLAQGIVFSIESVFSGRAGELWDLTSKAEARIKPAAISEASDILGGDESLHTLAIALVAEDGNLINAARRVSGLEPGEQGYQDVFIALVTGLYGEGGNENTKFAEAVSVMQRNRIGLGHQMAENAGVAQGTAGHGWASAGFELGTLMVLDPTIVLGKANRIRKIAQLGVQAGDLSGELNRAYDLAQIARRIDDIDDPLQAADDAVRAGVLAANSSTASAIRNSEWAKVIVTTGSQLEYGRSVNRTMERIADVARGAREVDGVLVPYSWSDLRREIPATKYLTQDLANAMNEGVITGNVDSVWDYFRHSQGQRALISGAVGRDPRVIALPRMSRGRERWAAQKNWWNKTLDLSGPLPQGMRTQLEDLSRQLRSDDITIGQFNEAHRVLNGERRTMTSAAQRWVIHPAQATVARMVKHVPRNPYIYTGTGSRPAIPGDPGVVSTSLAREGINEFERYLELGDLVNMDQVTKAAYLDSFIRGNQGQRVAIIRTYTTEVLGRTGLLDGSEEMQEILTKYGLSLRQNFGAGDELESAMDMTASGFVQHSAIWDKQLADSIAIPNFRSLQRAVRKENLLTAVAGRSMDRVDGLLGRFWKPAVLMRLGFIARAAGEETTSFVLRLGANNYLRSQFGRRWVNGLVMDPVTKQLVTIRDVAPSLRMARSVSEQMRRWSRSTDVMQISVGMAKASETKAARARVLVALGGGQLDEAGLLSLQDELRTLLAPEIAEYLAEMPATSRWMMNLGQWGVDATAWASPRMHDALRAARIPSRQTIARMVTGSTFEGSRRGITQWSHRPGLFSLDPSTPRAQSAFGSIRESVPFDNLMLAQTIAQSNPGVSRALMNGLGSAYAEYMPAVNRAAELPANQFLSSAPVLGEKLTWGGRKTYIPMLHPTQEWQAVDQLGAQARQAIGNALFYPGTDPAVTGSGAMLTMGAYVGPNLQDELVGMFGPEWRARLTEVRAQLAEFDDDDYLSELRRAFALGEDMPGHAAIDPAVLSKFQEASHDVQALIYPHRQFLAEPISTDLDEALSEASNRMRDFMNAPEYQPELAALTRMAFDRGVQIARPLPANQTRLYSMQISSEVTETLDLMASASEDLIVDLRRNLGSILSLKGFEAEQINGILPELMALFNVGGTWGDEIRAAVTTADAGLLTTPVLFTNPDVAQAALDALQDTLRQVGYIGVESPFKLAAVNVPNRELTNTGLFGRISTDLQNYDDFANWRTTDVFLAQTPNPHLDVIPLDAGRYTTFAELDNGQWIDTALPMPPGMENAEITGRTMLVNGESEHRLRLELGNLRLREMERLMIGPRGNALNAPISQLIGGTFDPGYHMHQVNPADLPTEAYAPVMVEHQSLRWDRIVSGWFQGVVDPAMNGIIRTPHFLHNFAASIPLADDYYRTTSALDPTDPAVRELLGQFDDDSVATLLDHIHAGFGDPDLIAEDSDWGRLMAALSNPRTKPEDGALALLRAMDGTNDKIDRATDEIYDALVESHVSRTGKIPDAADDGELEDLANLLVSGRYGPSDIRSRLEDVEEQLAEAIGAGRPTDVLETQRAALNERLANPLPPAPRIDAEDARTAGIVDQWNQLQNWSRNRNVRYTEAVEAASVRAVDMTVEFIDDHRFRSQFQQTVRNLVPFWFAEEQFLKRQIRMLVDTPEAIRRASLLMNAGRMSGMIDTDEAGNEIFVYPGSQMINETLMQFAGKITGMDGLEAFAQPMSTSVEYMMPGYTGNYIEGGTGPFIGFSTALLSSQFPELEFLDRNQLINPSEISQGRSPLEHFVPPVILKLTDTLGFDWFGKERLLSAQLRAIQMAAANGTAPAEDASAGEQEAFLDRTRAHARIINIMDFVLYGASPLPSGSKIRFGDAEVSEAYNQIVYGSGLPMAEAQSLFFQAFPEATPFTVFGSQSTTGAPIAVNAELYSMLDEYDQLVTDHPLAAAYLLPQPDGGLDDDYAARSARELYRRKLRERRTPQEYLDEVYYRDAANEFYDTRTAYEREAWLAEQKGDTTTAKAIGEEMAVWEEMFNEMHPTWNERRREHSQTNRRQKAKDERDAVLAMSREELPPGPDVDAILGLMLAHRTFNQEMEAIRGDDSAASDKQRREIRSSFFQYAAQYVQDYPAANAYFSSNIRWDSDVSAGFPDLLFETETALGRSID